MASFGSEGLAIIGSSPYARRGLLYDGWKRHFGKPDARNLVWQARTKTMNPTISDEFLAEEFEADPASAEAEYNAQFRSDVESFVAREVVEAAVANCRFEIAPSPGTRYFAFVDPSGGSSDSMTLAIAYRDIDNRSVLACTREAKPPFSPEAVVADFAATLKSYGLRSVTGDRYAGEWPRERFRVHGIEYVVSQKVKSDIYRDTLPLLNAGRIELLDNNRIVAQVASLERRTARGGRDTIDHAPNGHDDLANSVCGALLLASDRPQPFIVTDELLAASAIPIASGRTSDVDSLARELGWY